MDWYDRIKQFSVLCFDKDKVFIERFDFDTYDAFIDFTDNIHDVCPVGTRSFAQYFDGVFDSICTFAKPYPLQLIFDF